MRFIVCRASYASYDPASPCEGAIEISVPVIERRTYKSFEEYDLESPRWRTVGFLEEGTEHKVTPQGIQRRMGVRKEWAIDLEGLEELMKFIDTHGRCVVEPFIEEYPTITIYDSYLE